MSVGVLDVPGRVGWIFNSSSPVLKARASSALLSCLYVLNCEHITHSKCICGDKEWPILGVGGGG